MTLSFLSKRCTSTDLAVLPFVSISLLLLLLCFFFSKHKYTLDFTTVYGNIIVLTAITRGAGEYNEYRGYKSISPGQPYTTDPRWVQENREYRAFQKMENISHMRNTGEFRSGEQE